MEFLYHKICTTNIWNFINQLKFIGYVMIIYSVRKSRTRTAKLNVLSCVFKNNLYINMNYPNMKFYLDLHQVIFIHIILKTTSKS